VTSTTEEDALAERVHRREEYGSAAPTRLDPRAFATPRLAASLADKWLEGAREVPGSAGGVRAGVLHFLKHLETQTHAVDSAVDFDLPDLRRRHLDAWETSLLRWEQTATSDQPYARAVNLFTLLKRVDADDPGRLHTSVSQRLEQPTRLRHRRFPARPAFSPTEVKKLRACAHRVLHRHRATAAGEPTADVLAALHTLLSLSTGEPPEVLRRVSVNDVEATAHARHDAAVAGMTPAARLGWLARNNAVDIFAVSYWKGRAHGAKTEVYSRKDRETHRALTQLIAHTSALREESESDLLWLLRRPGGAIKHPDWGNGPAGLRKFAERHGIVVSEPAVFSRIRKVVVASEAATDPALFFIRGRQSPGMFFRHYTNSPVLRAHAGGLLLDTISGAFDAAVAARPSSPPRRKT
jgi:hypothetical protein